jgi:hypothetical protein
LLSASSVVVSALLPALELNFCGNEGQGWVSVTVLVPSGRPVSLLDLFAQPSRDLRTLADAWKSQFRKSDPNESGVVKLYPEFFGAKAISRAYFALTPHGLAVGFWQVGPTARLKAVVPYTVLQPHLSKLGKTLVAGVRTAR